MTFCNTLSFVHSTAIICVLPNPNITDRQLDQWAAAVINIQACRIPDDIFHCAGKYLSKLFGFMRLRLESISNASLIWTEWIGFTIMIWKCMSQDDSFRNCDKWLIEQISNQKIRGEQIARLSMHGNM